jgi:hypothetical protein
MLSTIVNLERMASRNATPAIGAQATANAILQGSFMPAASR